MSYRDETIHALETKMASWHRWWHINGDHLECVECKACQWPWNAPVPFHHEDGCSYAGGAPAYPWRDLAKIIR
jgi:hypothetical protein